MTIRYNICQGVQYAESRFKHDKFKRVDDQKETKRDDNEFPKQISATKIGKKFDNVSFKESFSAANWITAAATPLPNNEKLLFRRKCYVACNALPVGVVYNQLTKFHVAIDPHEENEELRRQIIYKFSIHLN